jgi:hypothetical protein
MQRSTEAQTRPIQDSLDKIADRVRQEREDTTVRVYKYKEENGYFTVSLKPVGKKRA